MGIDIHLSDPWGDVVMFADIDKGFVVEFELDELDAA